MPILLPTTLLDPSLPLLLVPVHPPWEPYRPSRLPVLPGPYPISRFGFLSVYFFEHVDRVLYSLSLFCRLHKGILARVRQHPMVLVQRPPELPQERMQCFSTPEPCCRQRSPVQPAEWPILPMASHPSIVHVEQKCSQKRHPLEVTPIAGHKVNPIRYDAY